MNPLVRHFLPSVIRGVYRFDNEFCTVRSEEDYAEFAETKFQFLPGNVRGTGSSECEADRAL
jgi:hypothetical protein